MNLGKRSVGNLAVRLLCVFLIIWFAACHGVKDRGADETAQVVRNTNAFRSLHLGQTDAPDSPVATTAAANNGEAIIVLNHNPGSPQVQQVLYLAPDSSVVRISYADGNLPSSAEAGGVQVSFSNVTEQTVDIQATGGGVGNVSTTIPIDDISQKLLGQVTTTARLARAAESADVIRGLYTRAIIGIRIFGCGTQNAFAAQGQQLPSPFAQIAQTACTSLLVDLLRAFLAAGDFTSTLISGLSDDSSCDFSAPGWAEDFSKAERCAMIIGDQLIDAIEKDFPDVHTAVETPTPTPAPTPQPQPSSSSNPPSSLHCRKGKFRCANGDRTCNEKACDGRDDCSDGSDEDSSLCTAEVLCCINSDGCPGESGGTCTSTCCCCGANQQCSRSPYLDGCVSSD